jgi:hypothetical protein
MLTVVELVTVAVTPVGVPGTDVIKTEEDELEVSLFPTALVALTLNVCEVPEGDVSKLVTVVGEPSKSLCEPPGEPVTKYEVMGIFPSHGAEYVTFAAPLS